MEEKRAQEIDGELAALHVDRYEARQRIASATQMLHHAAGDKRDWHGRVRVWRASDEDVIAKCRQLAESDEAADRSRCYVQRIPESLGRLDAGRAAELKLNSRIAALDAVYDADPWPRFFLVTSSDNGHVHRSPYCSTCYATTVFLLLPEYSGKDESGAVAAVVAGHGPYLCAVCFPGAPPEWRRDRADVRKEEAAARRAARDEEKYVKALRPQEEFRFGRERVTTVAGCLEVLRHEVALRDYYGRGEHPDHASYVKGAELAAEVLLARETARPGTGRTQEQIDKVTEAAIKKNRRDGARI